MHCPGAVLFLVFTDAGCLEPSLIFHSARAPPPMHESKIKRLAANA